MRTPARALRLLTIVQLSVAASCVATSESDVVGLGSARQALTGSWVLSPASPMPALVRPSPQTSYFRYAPSIVQTSPTVRYAYYCGNYYAQNPSQRDSILFSTSTKSGSTWSDWTPSGKAFEGSQNTVDLDEWHNCDPEYVGSPSRLVEERRGMGWLELEA